jgi:hypothetical protein
LGLGYFKKLRGIIFSKYFLSKITESLYEIFEAATVDNVVFWIINCSPRKGDNLIVLDSSFERARILDLLSDEEWRINLDPKPPIISKIDDNARLGDLCEVWQGLIAYHSKNQPRIYSSNKKETMHHRRLLFGSDIGRYFIRWEDRYLKYGDWLHRPRPSYIFDNPKILVQRIRNPRLKKRIIAAYDEQGFINGTGLSNILLNGETKDVSLKFILGLVNSSLINYWFSYYFKDVNIKPDQLRKIPIRKGQDNEQKLIVMLVDKILSLSKDNDYCQNKIKQAKVKEYERKIDQMVYMLYGLTEEEIQIVENSTR